MLQHDHAALSVFGIGTELKEAEWRGVVRQLLAQGLLAVEGEYGTLVLTPTSGEVMRGQRSVMLRREAEKAPRSRSSRSDRSRGATTAVELTGEATSVFETLRAWRAGAAKEQGVPAYVIFHDATLRQIATERPASLAALGTIGGVGETKLSRYGQQILDTLAG